MKKIIQFLKNKKAEFVASTSAVALMAGTSAYASDPTPPTMGDSVKTAVQTAVTDTLDMMMELLPIALTVFAAVWGVRKAMGFFKSASK